MSTPVAASNPPMDIETFLKQNEEKKLLRFTTAGSVDDGKSTLIGRLLYDSKGVYEDQLASVKKASVNRNAGPIDFSLLTDGLRAEREQGITIDVAYRYFSTPKRKFIIADTPGHEQYTRNMATGASTADLAIVLVDARKGVLPQSRRHAFIASLLGIPHVVVAVNKMDLVDYSQEVFEQIRRDFTEFSRQLEIRELKFIPISALEGDNVVSRSARTPWYEGPSLLDHLETVPVSRDLNFEEFRFPVQYVIRPSLDFRGYAGQISSGVIRPGDPVMVLPSGRTSKVKSITTWEGDLEEAWPPMSVILMLDDEIDISRGDMLVDPRKMPHVSRRAEATVVWMHADPLRTDRPYLLKHTTQQVTANIASIECRVNVNTLERDQASELHLNEIGVIMVETRKPLYFDPYRKNRRTGSFILIDPATNATVAAGMILERSRQESDRSRQAALHGVDFETSRVTPAERVARSGHHPATVWLTARKDLAYLVERKLFDRGCLVHVLADDRESHMLPELAGISNAAGLITVCSIASAERGERDRAVELVGAANFIELEPEQLSPKDEEAAEQIIRLLQRRGVLPHEDHFAGGEGI
ncbi:MAG: sulfate adenylyltransferase subunit CysN [Bryobacteraceae bacterium]